MFDLRSGSVAHTVLLYVVSEPGEWLPADIVDDLPDLDLGSVEDAIAELQAAGLLHVHSRDGSLWPRRGAREALQTELRAAG